MNTNLKKSKNLCNGLNLSASIKERVTGWIKLSKPCRLDCDNYIPVEIYAI